MADKVSPEVRSRIMAQVKSKGMKPEMTVESWRIVKGKKTRQVKYAIASLGPQRPADRLPGLARGLGYRKSSALCEGRYDGRGWQSGAY